MQRIYIHAAVAAAFFAPFPAFAAAPSTNAQGITKVAYPNRPVRLLVGFSPGGGSDILARMLGRKLTEDWGQQVVIDNRTGGGGIIASETTARADIDGHTLLMATSSLAIQPSITKRLPYDTLKDFTPITLAGSSPYLLLLHPTVEATSVKELIDLAKSRPGKLNYASAGAGSTLHLSAELFKSMAGVDIVHIPYKGAVAMSDLLAGQVQMAFFGLSTALPHVRSGKLKALGVTTPQRSATAPDIPTIAEAGLPGYQVTAWYGLIGPAGMDRSVVAKIQAAVVRNLQTNDIKQSMHVLGLDPVGSTPEAFARTIREEIAQWAGVVKKAGITAE